MERLYHEKETPKNCRVMKKNIIAIILFLWLLFAVLFLRADGAKVYWHPFFIDF